MRVLVTGGAGYVGSVLTPLLLQRGYGVVVLDNLCYNTGTTLLSCFIYKGFEFREGDTRNATLVRELVAKVDAVVHLAAIVGYPACRKDERLAHEVNVEGTRNIVQGLSPDQLVVFASTGSNYGSVPGICTEETLLNPLSVYGKTKTDAERIVASHPLSVVYRFATAFGISPRLRLDLMINDFVYQALHTRNLIVYERDFRRTFIHVRDMAESFIFALEHFDRMKGEVYNVGRESMNLTKEDVARAIRARLEFYLHFADVGKDEDQRNYEVSYQKIKSVGFEPQITLDQGLEELIAGLGVIKVKNPHSNI